MSPSKRYGVFLTFDDRRDTTRSGFAGRFDSLAAARKERDRQAGRAWFRVRSHADLLRRGSFRYKWRVWDFVAREYADDLAA